jgi:hypothetical protein
VWLKTKDIIQICTHYIKQAIPSYIFIIVIIYTPNCSHLTSSVRNLEAIQTPCSLVPSTLTETALSKRSPDLARVGATSQRPVSIDNRITCLDEVGVARLQRHSVHDQLHGQVLAVGGHTVVVEVGNIAVVLAVLVDQVPEDLVQHGGPDVSDGVDAAVQLDALVGLGVGSHGGRVQVVADTGGVAVDPRAHAVVLLARVGGLEADGGRVEVGPAFAHAAGFEQVEASRVLGPAGQAVGEAVGVLVDHNAGFEGAVTDGVGVGPDVPLCSVSIGIVLG